MKKLLAICLFTATLIPVHAQYLFDFRDDVDLYSALTGQAGPISFTNNGLVATFSASDGTMNRTADGFGINASLPFDDTDAFDNGEWIDITFDMAIPCQILILRFRLDMEFPCQMLFLKA